jgi:LysM repeat protein
MTKEIQPAARRAMLIVASLLLALTLLVSTLYSQPANAAPQAVTCSTYHTVAAGETVSSIAQKYNITVAELVAANNLKEPYTIYVNQQLCIPGSAAATTTPAASTKTGPNFTIKASKTGDLITITVANYPKKKPYYVRAEYGKFPDIISRKIGTLRTNDKGAAEKTFKVPRQFRTKPYVRICLKNALTDAVQCNTYIPPAQ